MTEWTEKDVDELLSKNSATAGALIKCVIDDGRSRGIPYELIMEEILDIAKSLIRQDPKEAAYFIFYFKKNNENMWE